MSIIGIDLGTSNSLASVWREDGVVLIPNVMGTVFTPSVVSMDDDGSLLVGHAARERLVVAPERTVAAFKRDMGTDRTYALGGRAFTPEELSSLVLRRLKEDAEVFLGEPVREAVISVPAYFDDRQRAATRRAGLLAGLHVERLVTEPSAAALTCRMGNHSDDFTAMVFDFGGGTLDVSIVDCFENVISVLALAGDNRLGGNDFDLALARAFCEANGHRFDTLRPQARTALLFAAESAKRALTASERVTLSVPGIDLAGELSLDNQALIDASTPLFQRLSAPIRRALADSGVALDDIKHVILAGGSCHMPAVREFLRQTLQREPESLCDPDTVVGMGAGLYAGIKERREGVRDVVMTDLCPFTLGTSIKNDFDDRGGVFSPIIERNSALPASETKRYYTVADFQSRVVVDVYQGEAMYCRDNLYLGELAVNVPPGPAGREAVDVRFTYDINGILGVAVTVCSTGHTQNRIVLQKGTGLTEAEASQRLQELAELDLSPREGGRTRAALACAERLFAQSRGGERESLKRNLERFRRTIAHAAPTMAARHLERFEQYLDSLERHLAGEGLLPDDMEPADAPFPDENDGRGGGTPVQ